MFHRKSLATIALLGCLATGCGGTGGFGDAPPPPPPPQQEPRYYSVITDYGNGLTGYETVLTHTKGRRTVILLHGAGYEGGVVMKELQNKGTLYNSYVGYFRGEHDSGLVGQIASNGFNTVILDLPGAGASVNFKNLKPEQITIDTMLDAIDQVVDKVTKDDGEKPIIIGHSLGGHLALKYFVDNTNKVHAIGLLGYHPAVGMPDLPAADLSLLTNLSEPCISYNKIKLSTGVSFRRTLMFTDAKSAQDYSTQELVDDDARAENCVPNKVFKGLMTQLLTDTTRYDALTPEETGRIYQQLYVADALYNLRKVKTQWIVRMDQVTGTHAMAFNQPSIRAISENFILNWLRSFK